MNIADLRQKNVGILGFGQEGQAVSSYLSRNEVKHAILEQHPREHWTQHQQTALNPQFTSLKTGRDHLQGLENFEVIFRSPGFPRLHPELVNAEEKGSIITSQAKWFFDNSQSYTIGITGTKGKGTTSSLIFAILRAAKSKGMFPEASIYLTGNIGKEQPLDFLDQITEQDLVVYELSSFQLQDLTTSPDLGICLMVTQDHLDHHSTIDEYHDAKSAICKFQSDNQVTIYNADYDASNRIGKMGLGKKYIVSQNEQNLSGAFIMGDIIHLQGLEDEVKIDVTTRKLRGSHNMENIAAAALAAAVLKVDAQTIQQVSNDFPGLEHRLQLIGQVQGISFYNDSISTVPETAIAAIKAITEPVLLVLGGSDKGISYQPLVDFLLTQSHVKAIALIGQTGPTIESLLKKANFTKPLVTRKGSFTSTLAELVKLAAIGDAVLLSPASASFDMFENYADRGNQFAAFVKSLKDEEL